MAPTPPTAPVSSSSARNSAGTVELKAVRKCYDDFVAVDDISFSIQPGKIYGLLGPNGAGKTSTLRMIIGIIVPDSGQITVFGEPRELQIPLGVLVAFAAFFLLGYLLYSTMYAAVGAITTTEQEGQQLQFLIIVPLVLSVFMLAPVVRNPDAPAMVWMSMVPFFAPVVMYARIVVQTPPLWQIALSLILLIATIAGLLVMCARIYRIGILIYGKRPNLPEILKWLKYAKA